MFSLLSCKFLLSFRRSFFFFHLTGLLKFSQCNSLRKAKAPCLLFAVRARTPGVSNCNMVGKDLEFQKKKRIYKKLYNVILPTHSCFDSHSKIWARRMVCLYPSACIPGLKLLWNFRFCIRNFKVYFGWFICNADCVQVGGWIDIRESGFVALFPS